MNTPPKWPSPELQRIRPRQGHTAPKCAAIPTLALRAPKRAPPGSPVHCCTWSLPACEKPGPRRQFWQFGLAPTPRSGPERPSPEAAAFAEAATTHYHLDHTEPRSPTFVGLLTLSAASSVSFSIISTEAETPLRRPCRLSTAVALDQTEACACHGAERSTTRRCSTDESVACRAVASTDTPYPSMGFVPLQGPLPPCQRRKRRRNPALDSASTHSKL